MRETFLIGLDLGTSAIKGVLSDGQGVVLAEAGAATSHLHPQDGWVEIDPEAQYQRVCGVLRELVAAAPGEIAAVAMAAASGNTLLSDAAGRPLMPIISWMDRRAELDPPAALAGLDEAEMRRITGWPCVTSFPLAHLAWLRQRRPELFHSAGHYGMDTDWLLHRLTGRWVIDHSTATTFHLHAQLRMDYHQPFLDLLDLPRERLSELVNPGTIVGQPTAAAQRDTGLSPSTRIVAGCFDHPAAARAVGVLQEGQLLLSCGTSWVGFTPMHDRQAILAAPMLCDPFLTPAGGPWGGIFSVPSIGPAIDWYIDHVIAPGAADRLRIFNESAAAAPPGAGGLEIDLRLPPRPLDADRRNISRAVMEGAARLLGDKLRAVGRRFDRAVMVGGPAASPIWPGIVAATLGLEVTVGPRSAGAQGAARLAGLAITPDPRTATGGRHGR